MKKYWSAVVAMVPVMAASPIALGAGFALKEQSGTALGNAFAGASSAAEDPSYMFFNPATVGRMDGVQGVVTSAYISPTSELKDAEYNQPLNPAGSVVMGSTSLNDIGDDALVPAIYATAQVHDQIRLGLGVNVPYGLSTSHDDDWVGRYHAIDSEVFSLNFNPVVAYNPVPEVSVAAGLQIQYLEADLSNAIDFATIATGAGAGPFPAGALDGKGEVDGDDIAYGFTLGLLAEPIDGTKIGVGYRSKIDHTLNGDADFDVPQALAGTPVGLTFQDTSATASVETPAMLNLGISQDVGDKLTLMLEGQWTQWSSFDELRIQFDNTVPDSITEEDWDDQWFVAVGATYRPTPAWALRFGTAYDQKPLDTNRRTPRIPDNDRFWLAFGVDYNPNEWLSFNAGYTHLFVQDADVRLRAEDPGNAARGDLDAEYEANVDIFALSAVVRW